MLSATQAEQYLQRIGCGPAGAADEEQLRLLHRAHLLHVPFENLDIHWKRPIVLDVDRFFEKIVTRKRGGFCFELNGLFHALLVQLGYEVTMLSARVFGEKGYSPEYDHLCLLVEISGNSWIADVGFGEFSLSPLLLQEELEQESHGKVYRIVQQAEDRYRIDCNGDARGFVPEYSFTLQPQTLDAFAERCTFHQTSPESHFMQKRICSVATETGRISITDQKLVITINGQRRYKDLQDEAAFEKTLSEQFGIFKSA